MFYWAVISFYLEQVVEGMHLKSIKICIMLKASWLWKSVSCTELYLKLEDVTRRFQKPCIMDVKIGQRSYDPFASQEKREQQIRKYPLMEEIGFLLLGMRVSIQLATSCLGRFHLIEMQTKDFSISDLFLFMQLIDISQLSDDLKRHGLLCHHFNVINYINWNASSPLTLNVSRIQ